MKRRLIFSVLVITAFILYATGGMAVADIPDKAQGHIPDRVLVKFLPGTPEITKANVHARQGGQVMGVIPDIGVQVVKIPRNRLNEKVKAYRGEASVVFAEPDYVAEAIFQPNDTYLGTQWAISKIQATITSSEINPLLDPVSIKTYMITTHSAAADSFKTIFLCRQPR